MSCLKALPKESFLSWKPRNMEAQLWFAKLHLKKEKREKKATDLLEQSLLNTQDKSGF